MSNPLNRATRPLSRRRLLGTGLAAAAGSLASPAWVRVSRATERLPVAPGHAVDILLRWGDPVVAGAPAFDPAALSPDTQARQFGYNCDFTGLLPFDGSLDHGLLVVNHESSDPSLMFSPQSEAGLDANQVGTAMAAQGVSVVELRREGDGRWVPQADSRFNRRITADSRCTISGPAAGHRLLATTADPEGRIVRGTIGSCAGGKTPWGTFLSAEENFQEYFGGIDQLADDDPRRDAHRRYGIGAESGAGWEAHQPRFSLASEPNEPFRFGWIVEVDPFNPDREPIKRSALGRMRHEAATSVLTPGNHVAVYMGDDAYFEYAYKFVSARPFDAGDPEANLQVLDEGTLYAARFNDDGSGEWLPLVHGRGPLTEANGFHSQAEVLIHTRRAADLVGATPLDRPEDMEASPVTGKVYLALTKNKYRGVAGNPAVDAANPRSDNAYGHILELQEFGKDGRSERFSWEILMLCGDPNDPGSRFAGYEGPVRDAIACPDNLAFDVDGNLWVATDGMPDALGLPDGLFAVTLEGPERGRTQRFLSGVLGSEITGPEFSPDGRGVFVSVQHPGEGSSLDAPSTRWPDGSGPPRPSVVLIRRLDGDRIQPARVEADGSAMPAKLPATGRAADRAPSLVGLSGLGTLALGALLRWRERRLASMGTGQ